jgi:hypothetical protein
MENGLRRKFIDSNYIIEKGFPVMYGHFHKVQILWLFMSNITSVGSRCTLAKSASMSSA